MMTKAMRQARERLNRWFNLTFGRQARNLPAETRMRLVNLFIASASGDEAALAALQDHCEELGLAIGPLFEGREMSFKEAKRRARGSTASQYMKAVSGVGAGVKY